jgi:hypothetical protein
MTVLVIGASDRAVRQLREIAPSGVDIVSEAVAEADWMIVATTDQRIEAVRSHGLEAFRILEFPEIASELDSVTMDALRSALVKMGGIGGSRPLLSSIGLALVRPFVRRNAKTTGPEAGEGPLDDPETRMARSGVPKPMPAGVRLDELLAASERKRAERFVAQAVRSSDGRS